MTDPHLGKCAMYECARDADFAVRIQPDELGGLVLDVPLCQLDAGYVRQELDDD